MNRLILLIGFILPLQIFGQVWVARYNGSVSSPGAYDVAYAMAVDDSGYIYVTGESCDTAWSDYMTIKYNSAGDTMWVRKYNGPDNSDDQAYAIAVDKNGNVYVTGRSVGTGTGYDYATLKYNRLGTEMWARRYNYSSSIYNTDGANSIAVDDSGNVYVTGDSYSGTNYDYATIKYNSSGDTIWAKRYNGPEDNHDKAYAIAIDNSGNVYITGESSLYSGTYATIKYNSSGDTMWVRRYSAAGKGYKAYEEPKEYDYNKTKGFARMGGGAAIAIDNSGNVYVTGESWDSSFGYATTIKYNLTGDTAWVRKYYSGRWAEGTALALDSNGNVYITGREGHTIGDTTVDYVTIKYNNSGDTMWVRKYNGTGNRIDCATGIALDNNGNVYVTGYSEGNGTYTDYATIKYSSSGSEEWVQRYNGPGNNTDYAYAIAVDNKGYVYVTGISHGIGTDDYLTIKYSCVGIEEKQWPVVSGEWSVTASPNPFAQKTVVSGQWSVDSKTKIRIYDISGKLVKETKDNVIGKDLKSGIYFVRVNDYKPIKVVKMSYIK
ncbi:MAG: SBBP repeat-containing protein [bacterium]|nr:SBBP repeat-containing protein [bacterium]